MDEIVVKFPTLDVFWVVLTDLHVCRKPCPMLERLEREIPERWTVEKLLQNEIIRAYRDFFWSIGIDPTKERPSSEALIRRILNGKRIPRINCAVDAMNAASIETLITFGLLDLDEVKTPLVLRESKIGEKMVIIGGKEITIPKGFPIIEDSNGVIVSSTIYRDGEVAKITEKTRNLLLIGYAPPGIEKGVLRAAVNKAENYIRENCSKSDSERE
ncbi:MAG: B3/B4 domain-containing protein [Candidatus Njordarchaeia archaeon]